VIPLDTIEPGAVPAYVTIEAAGSCGGGAQLAAVLGVRAATVSRWANGHTRPNVRHMRTLCSLAGVCVVEARRRWKEARA
jgi:transcriptional regulator with XRE-family HTH domain